MTSPDTSLYGIRKQRKLGGGREISSSTSLSFTSQLSNLISASSSSNSSSRPRPQQGKAKKDDIFRSHARNGTKRAKIRHDEDAPSFEQKHTTSGERLDNSIWERSRRKMEEKARLYAAMKRGDIEDTEEKYAVDFDRKWAERADANGDGVGEDDEDDDDDEDEDDQGQREIVEYEDEFGRTRKGTRAAANAAERIRRGQADLASDRFTARPSAPATIIRGDTIQHDAFNPDALVAAQMEALAAKRDKSLTPPPDEHFDARKEVRNKGTGFFQFSADADERKRQMDNLEAERAETERRRRENEEKHEARRKKLDDRRRMIAESRSKRKADDFLTALGDEMVEREEVKTRTDMTNRIESAVEAEKVDERD